MSDHRAEGPPAEAYSRVTNPERFVLLHDAAVQLLERQYAVTRSEGFDVAVLPAGVSQLRTGVRLVPESPESAPITVSFTAFPGIFLNCGEYSTLAFPRCGCDACKETGDGEVARFLETVEDVIMGRFREEITIKFGRRSEVLWTLWSESHRTGGGEQVRESSWHYPGRHRRIDWQPWPRRELPFQAFGKR